ncbi:MAG: large conductance mechanosensitive channel protein MscL [Chloroflexi bacterium]|nr:large conductance mechanosensitive channel protein MscL [Chloroflexota bacterium]
MSGFRKFILRGNVVDLAVAVVIGASFAAVVTALVKDIITPIVGIFGGIPDFSAEYFTIGASRFLIGEFINAVLAFLVMAVIIYFFIVLPVNTLLDRFGPTPEPAVRTRICPECLSKIPLKARRCAFCTSEVPEEVVTTSSPGA